MDETGKLLSTLDRCALRGALDQSGLRATRQREEVYRILLEERDHPTADEVYMRAKKRIGGLSLATVYNCLDTLVACDLVKKLNFEREPSRYCPNQGEHAHFLDEHTGRVYDIDLPDELFEKLRNILPPGYEARKVKLSFSGTLADGHENPPVRENQ